MSTGQFVLALLCVLLIAVCGLVQASHIHPAGELLHADCALCATAHLTAQVISPVVILLVAPIAGAVENVAPLACGTSFSTFALFTRPPPDETASA